MRLVQAIDRAGARRVGMVKGDQLDWIIGPRTMHALALSAIAAGRGLVAETTAHGVDGSEAYAAVIADQRILPPLDHDDHAHCWVTGTGLTHLGGAAARDAMHKKLADAAQADTDSIRMFKAGLEGGKPTGAEPGVQPEWFYKGDGSTIVAPEADIGMPEFALDGGEEPELAGLYVVAPNGQPYRLGFALGNEFSDHVTERQNYLLLAHSKLRRSAIGPELIVGDLASDLVGESRILRDGAVAWRKPFVTGEANMSHAISNLEFHHFKYALFRRPGDVHIHYFGTATLSFADGFRTAPGDVFEIELPGFGRPLRNRLVRTREAIAYGSVTAL
jgi:hypothetical protein